MCWRGNVMQLIPTSELEVQGDVEIGVELGRV